MGPLPAKLKATRADQMAAEYANWRSKTDPLHWIVSVMRKETHFLGGCTGDPCTSCGCHDCSHFITYVKNVYPVNQFIGQIMPLCGSCVDSLMIYLAARAQLVDPIAQNCRRYVLSVSFPCDYFINPKKGILVLCAVCERPSLGSYPWLHRISDADHIVDIAGNSHANPTHQMRIDTCARCTKRALIPRVVDKWILLRCGDLVADVRQYIAALCWNLVCPWQALWV